MNAGQQCIEWLYTEQLKVDNEWAVRTPKGFTWWADRYAQTIEVVGEAVGPDGDTGYFVSVRTDLLRCVPMNEFTLMNVHAALTPFPSMAGPVLDSQRQTLSLCSLVRVHQGINRWMSPLISTAAALQIGEARAIGPALAEVLGAQAARSEHPRSGKRKTPDEMADLIPQLIAPLGQQPSRWGGDEFESAVDQCMRQPPALLATADDAGITVEFPFGEESSLCRMMADQPHPQYGNGLLLLQSFPLSKQTDTEGIRLALAGNETELTERPFGYGFGSYSYRDSALHFTSFFPNAVYRSGLLPNLYYACAGRARETAIHLTGHDWTPESFSARKSAIGRFFDRLTGR